MISLKDLSWTTLAQAVMLATAMALLFALTVIIQGDPQAANGAAQATRHGSSSMASQG